MNRTQRAAAAAIALFVCSIAGPASAGRAAKSFKGQTITLSSLLDEMTDLARLGERQVPAYTTATTTSHDPASNPPCAPGEPCWFANDDRGHFLRVENNGNGPEYVLLDVQGPGVITRIWSGNPTGTLRLYIDGAATPALVAPMEALLGGQLAPFGPLAYKVGCCGHNLYFPIPYDGSIKITVDRNVDSRGYGLYYSVSYRTYAGGTAVEPFNLVAATALGSRIVATAITLNTPQTAYLPSPAHHHSSTTLTVGGGPLTLDESLVGGAGAIVRELRLAPALTDEASLRTTLLTLRFDGRLAVQAPLGDFFGTGPGLNPYESFPLAVRAEGTLVSRFAMPFEHTLTIELTGGSAQGMAVGCDVELEPYDWNARSMHFNASWRADHAVYAHDSRDWNVVTLTGDGHYVGTVWNLASPFIDEADWWGEGDEKIWVDGEPFPSHFGTGIEDYFGYAWGGCLSFAKPYHASTRCDGFQPPAFPAYYGRTSVNRFLLSDAIPFTQSLRFDVEETFTFWATDYRADLVDAVAYWYAIPGTTHDHGTLAPGDLTIADVPARIEPTLVGQPIDAHAMDVLSSPVPGMLMPQTTAPWETADRLWYEQDNLLWFGGDIGDELALGFTVPQNGWYDLSAYLTRSFDSAIVDLRVDGVPGLSGLDLFEAQIRPTGRLVLDPPGPATTWALAAGPHTLGVTIAGSSCASCTSVGLDVLAQRFVQTLCSTAADCDDGAFCNGAETCDAGQCHVGVPPSCDDGQSCTADACNESADVCDHVQADPTCDDRLWISFADTTTLPGLGAVRDEDVVAYDATTGVWSLVFDGSDVGLDAFDVTGAVRLPSGGVLLSVTPAGTIGGVTVDDSDVVLFTPTSLGETTAGSFSLYFDGSDVGLSAGNEGIDALALTPGGRLVISTTGQVSAGAADGGDEDLWVFEPTSLGPTTAGTFAPYLDGSDVGLSTSNENIDAAAITSSGDVLLSTTGAFSAGGTSGGDEDVLRFTPTSLGASSAGAFAMVLDLSALGIDARADIDALCLVEGP